MRLCAVRRSPATRFVLCAVLTVVLTVASILLIDPMRAWINVPLPSGVVYVAAKAEKQRGNTARAAEERAGAERDGESGKTKR